MTFVYNDGGRRESGRRGHTGDCVTRSIAIALGLPYERVYSALADGTANEVRGSKGSRISGKRSASHGVHTKRQWFKEYMESLGMSWVPTMAIGQGCTVHLRADELPGGRIIVALSKHYTAVIDGVIHDTGDPSRQGTRCVYGYWIKKETLDAK